MSRCSQRHRTPLPHTQAAPYHRGAALILKGEGSEIGSRHSSLGQRRQMKSHSCDYPGLRYQFYKIGHGIVGGRAEQVYKSFQ